MSSRYMHIDTIGVGDNRMVYNDQEILNHIEKEIIKLTKSENVNSIAAVLITESIKSDILSLRVIFQQIRTIFGYLPLESIVVLGTKRNDCSKVFGEKRVA